MIISFLNQKGGSGKSTLARAVAVEFVRNNWGVHVADMDTGQGTFFKWAGRREEANIKPSIEVALYREPKAAIKAADNSDLLIIDGKAFADNHIKEISKASDLIVITAGIAIDDLQPSINLANELLHNGISKTSILFVVCKVTDTGNKEAMKTRDSIKNWGFEAVQGWINMQTGYSKAMDSGRALTESSYKQINEKADKVVKQIGDRALELQALKMEDLKHG